MAVASVLCDEERRKVSDLISLSARIIDEGLADELTNRATQELSEVAPGVAVVESFGHCVAFRTDRGLVVFDTSNPAAGRRVVQALRGWSTEPVHTIVYTHGHLDHVGGSIAFVEDAHERGFPRPTFVANAAIRERFARYRLTDGWNRAINRRQFRSRRNVGMVGDQASPRMHFLPDDVSPPDIVFDQTLAMSVGNLAFELHHARGETDDHLWAWVPERRAVVCGDFLIWNFPNAGNPQKVQRYPGEWATALRQMAALEPELLLPAHGLPIGGRERIARVLGDVASALEQLVDEVVAMMNAGEPLDSILHSVAVPDEVLQKPYLRPMYDEPEFVIRNIWRLYGGWWDGNPARLKPPADGELATEVADLAGGAATLAERAQDAARRGRLRLACQLVEWARQASSEDPEIQRVAAAIYEARVSGETSLMARAIFSAAKEPSGSAPTT